MSKFDRQKQIPGASITILLSYDYNHFEYTFHAKPDSTLDEINELRKDCQRLADEAVRQYKVAKSRTMQDLQEKQNVEELTRKVRIIKENFSQAEWTPEQKGMIKALEDWNYRPYDYDDDGIEDGNFR
jgi:flagellar motility protein MotE (MotC chaperone)